MNYEEKYKQALERARKELQECVHKDCDNMTRRTATTIIHNLFPELKESEDERIRKALIEMIHDTPGIECEENYNVSKEDVLAWLEKQSEKKSADEVLKIRQELYQSGYNDGYKHGQEDTVEIDERIRKAIYNALKYLETELSWDFVDEVDILDIYAWLEKQGKKLDADEVIAWLVANIRDYEYFVEWFKKDFGL